MKYNYLIIYCTTNSINDKKYVGKHLTNDENDDYLGSGIILKGAIEKYGKEFFESEILESCQNIEELNKREVFWIKEKNSHVSKGGYNLTWGGDGGDTFSDSTNKETTSERRSKSLKKYWNNLSEEEKQKRFDKLRGKKRSDESKKRYSESKKGIKKSPEHLKNLSASLKKAKAGKTTYNQRKVDMYDLEMNFLGTFDSIHQAARSTGHNANDICQICKNKKKKIKNHIFKYNNHGKECNLH